MTLGGTLLNISLGFVDPSINNEYVLGCKFTYYSNGVAPYVYHDYDPAILLIAIPSNV